MFGYGGTMRRLFVLIWTMLLFAALMNGAAVNAAELGDHGSSAANAQWLHAAGDADEVPADAGKNAPHHHITCQGHDLGTPIELRLPALWAATMIRAPEQDMRLAEAQRARNHRPPIA